MYKSQQFVQRVIETIYNYGSNGREQFLLLNLFREALRLEMTKIETPKDFITGNPTVIKLVINHHRGVNASPFLATLFRPLITELLAETSATCMDFSISPPELYKTWLNKTEAATGIKSTLPYYVEKEAALAHEHVRAMLHLNTTALVYNYVYTYVYN